uniref:Uncharacterized protein n=1 Tax=Romanomermis culicivorax TaxID=13658 RepID=A0A915HFX4_ROMCU
MDLCWPVSFPTVDIRQFSVQNYPLSIRPSLIPRTLIKISSTSTPRCRRLNGEFAGLELAILHNMANMNPIMYPLSKGSN